MIALLWVGLALAGAITAVAALAVARRNGGTKRVDAAVVVVAAYAVTAAGLKLWDVAFTGPWSRRASTSAAELTYVTAAFALLGLWREGGVRSRVIVAVGAAFALLALSTESELEWAVVGVALVVAAAEMFARLAERGWAAPLFVVSAVALVAPGGPEAPAFAIGAGIGLAVLLAERAGRADVGAGAGMALGAFAAWGVQMRGPHVAWLAALVVVLVASALLRRQG